MIQQTPDHLTFEVQHRIRNYTKEAEHERLVASAGKTSRPFSLKTIAIWLSTLVTRLTLG